MKDFTQLKRNLKEDFSSLKKIKVALLGDTATQFLALAIRGEGYERGFDLNVWEADFNQVERQVLDQTSELYEVNPDVVVLFQSAHKLLGKYNKLKPEQQIHLADNEMGLIRNLATH